ncbi:MAG: NAD(P)/FAD-dependent oxidoreductase [Euryarchaeota archaeon]|jgi:digeranylgeranylglycerophospholipid reductase|nr:NAD(P)/FAD-dependent oxidoreductase [Euryarchaeota archaeon]
MADRIKTDVLVVGAGPAGSTVARYAAEKGAEVLMIERRPEVGVPVRCGELMPSVEEIKGMFPNLGDEGDLFEMPSHLRLREVDGIRLVDPRGKSVMLDFTGYTTDRDRFDQHLAAEAQAAGAGLMRDCMFRGIEGGVADTSCGEIEYKVIVGADGPGSRVARALGLPGNRNPYPAVTAQAKGDFDPQVVMFFGDIAPGAYSWIIPKVGQANVGVGFSPNFADGTPTQYFREFADKHGFDIISSVHGKHVPSEGAIGRTVAGNGMVVGDAAGHVISVNGGGVPLALIAGRICGEVAGDHVTGSRPLADYEREWRHVLYKPLKIAAGNKKLADTFAFGSERRTALCMALLGKRRMGNLIRCKHLFP